ncbi:MAG: ribonuclease HII [Clostridium sp.]|nr:ribonuclease HII [Clostridium sp.]
MKKKMTIKQIELSVKELEVNDALEKLYDLKIQYGDKIDKIIKRYEKKKDKYQKEQKRYRAMCSYENEAYESGNNLIAGIDEAGRGPLAGPVVAAAVILPRGIFIEGLNDSKKLSPQKRERIYDIIADKAVSIGIGVVDVDIIDKINILNATKMAMLQAVEALDTTPEILFIDSEKLDNIELPQKSLIKGDAKSVSIAAASVVAKVTRDKMIGRMDQVYPLYGFAKHKGYGTKEHIEAIRKHGICPIHRMTFTKKIIG